jgi:hypothetical protein
MKRGKAKSMTVSGAFRRDRFGREGWQPMPGDPRSDSVTSPAATLLRPQSRLADRRWVAAAKAYIADSASVAEAFKRDRSEHGGGGGWLQWHQQKKSEPKGGEPTGGGKGKNPDA